MRRPSRAAIFAIVLFGTLFLGGAATPQEARWETEALLVEFFPASERVTWVRVELGEEEMAELERRVGERPSRARWTIFVALTGERVDGYCVVDEEMGQHEPITFGARLSVDGTVERVEVMVYREAYGGEIDSERFRAQFGGLDWRSRMEVGREIVAVAGATISSEALAAGVRRVSAVVGLLRERLGERLGAT